MTMVWKEMSHWMSALVCWAIVVVIMTSQCQVQAQVNLFPDWDQVVSTTKPPPPRCAVYLDINTQDNFMCPNGQQYFDIVTCQFVCP